MSKLAQSILFFSSRRFEKAVRELQAEAGFSKHLELKIKIDCASLDIRINPVVCNENLVRYRCIPNFMQRKAVLFMIYQ